MAQNKASVKFSPRDVVLGELRSLIKQYGESIKVPLGELVRSCGFSEDEVLAAINDLEEEGCFYQIWLIAPQGDKIEYIEYILYTEADC